MFYIFVTFCPVLNKLRYNVPKETRGYALSGTWSRIYAYDTHKAKL